MKWGNFAIKKKTGTRREGSRDEVGQLFATAARAVWIPV